MSDRLLVEIALKSTVVMLAAWVAATWMWSRSSAGTRHLTWAVSLVAVLLVPILVAFGPDWSIPVSIGVDEGVVGPLANRSSAEARSGGVLPSSAEPRASGAMVDADALFPPAPPAAAPPPSSFRWPLGAIWLAGFVVCVLR